MLTVLLNTSIIMADQNILGKEILEFHNKNVNPGQDQVSFLLVTTCKKRNNGFYYD